MTDTRTDAIAERLLREAAEAITTPEQGECLHCFVARLLDAFGCDGELRLARRYRDLRAPRAVALERRLAAVGGTCDCEIFLRGWWLREELEDDEHDHRPHGRPLRATPVRAAPGGAAPVGSTDRLPPCAGVRPGSTQPCSRWVRRRPRRQVWW